VAVVNKTDRFTRFANPLLQALRNLGGSGRPGEVYTEVAKLCEVPQSELDIMLPSGGSRIEKDVAFVRYYLAQEGYIDASMRGVWSLSEKGQNAHLSDDDIRGLSRRVARRLAERRSKEQITPNAPDEIDETEEPAPVQAAEASRDHRDRLISVLRSLSPDGFERLAQRLLRESGFREVNVTGRAGDGGIDGNGVLQLNPLVSIKVLFQCKRYSGSVTPSQVRDFRGALRGRADKGIFITTGTFTQDAKSEATRDGAEQIELIDIMKLVELLEALELGVRREVAYAIDDRFFDEYR